MYNHSHEAITACYYIDDDQENSRRAASGSRYKYNQARRRMEQTDVTMCLCRRYCGATGKVLPRCESMLDVVMS